MAAKTTSKTQKAKPHSRVKASAVTQRPTYAELRQQLAESLERLHDRDQQLAESLRRESATDSENERLSNALNEALEQQKSTSEILRVIASSGTDLQPLLDTIAESAARLCDSVDAQIYSVEGDMQRKVASYGMDSSVLGVGETRPLRRGSASGRAILDQQPVHIHDTLAEDQEDYADVWPSVQRLGIRTALAVPLMREAVPIGAITIRRKEVRPFTDKQIALLKTFADQAVIAIENVRLFKELQERNRELTEALEQQTATSEVLEVIAGSPTELQPVLNTVVANAVRLAGAKKGHIYQHDGEFLRVTAFYNETPEELSCCANCRSSRRPAV